jgi:hypothetical protein
MGAGYNQLIESLSVPSTRVSDRLDTMMSSRMIGPLRPRTEQSDVSKEKLDLFKRRMMDTYSKKKKAYSFSELFPKLGTRDQAAFINLRNDAMKKEQIASMGGFMGGQGFQIAQQTATGGSKFITMPSFARSGINPEIAPTFKYTGEFAGRGGVIPELKEPNIMGLTGINAPMFGSQLQGDFGGKVNSILSMNLPKGFRSGNSIQQSDNLNDEDKVKYFMGLKR